MTKTISTAELERQLSDPALVIIDVRPMAAYNGWPLPGEARGGHIRGAVPFPLSWIDHLAPADLEPLLASKGVTRDKTIVVYGDTRDEGAAMIGRLEDLGYENVRHYAAGLAGWAADGSLPLDRLARYEKLVHPEWLHSLITGGRAETKAGQGFAVLHVTSGAPNEYDAGHIPGALQLDTDALESPASWNRRPAEELEAALLAHGITHDKTVILYGRDSVLDVGDPEPGQHAGQIAAARAAVILMYAGVQDVRLLDGGYDAWLAAGYAVENVPQRPTPVAAFGAPLPGRPEYIIDMHAAKALSAAPDGLLVSVRSWPEYIGTTSGYSYIQPKGRIAGAVWGGGGSDAYHMQGYRNVDNTMRAYHEIEARWQVVGLTPDKRAAFYCGTGWRASEAFFCAYLMGWERVAVYDGGWFEWSQDPSNPIEVGEI